MSPEDIGQVVAALLRTDADETACGEIAAVIGRCLNRLRRRDEDQYRIALRVLAKVLGEAAGPERVVLHRPTR